MKHTKEETERARAKFDAVQEQYFEDIHYWKIKVVIVVLSLLVTGTLLYIAL